MRERSSTLSAFWNFSLASSASMVLLLLLIFLCALSFLAFASLALGGSISVAENRKIWRGEV